MQLGRAVGGVEFLGLAFPLAGKVPGVPVLELCRFTTPPISKMLKHMMRKAGVLDDQRKLVNLEASTNQRVPKIALLEKEIPKSLLNHHQMLKK
jgi:hypothetical protein